ncbi:ABC transporter ATP-binding protein [Niveibacterium sp. SC-1]|uniref:ABC transporter ATP-binding protein n=1 Tax=Niveibacterium sp. SC-1 TaxID=3135646 RepID=UPI00311DC169
MARIELLDLAHSYKPAPKSESDYALRPLNISWRDGGAYALLGPSGCGKTTLLNVMSGLLHPSQGRVLFDGRDVTGLPPRQRNIAQVFQFPVIYDTMTVFENLAFPLRNRGIKEPEVRSRVHEIAEILELSGDLKRRASGLSAEAKQTVSLGRGLVRKDVAAVLFDEPLTVIDPHLKWLLRRKLKRIHQQLKLSLVYVTHDQVEAMTFADEVVVMFDGQVVQSGTPQELFEAPAHTFVGYFIGSPGMNLLPCQLDGDGVRIAEHRLQLAPEQAAKLKGAGQKLTLGIRPEFVRCARAQVPGSVPVAVASIDDLGTHKILTGQFAGQTLKAKLEEHEAPAGDRVWLQFPPQHTLFYADDRRCA